MSGGGGKPHRKGETAMARKKRSGNQDKGLQTIVLVTAILNLIRALVDMIGKLTG